MESAKILLFRIKKVDAQYMNIYKGEVGTEKHYLKSDKAMYGSILLHIPIKGLSEPSMPKGIELTPTS